MRIVDGIPLHLVKRLSFSYNESVNVPAGTSPSIGFATPPTFQLSGSAAGNAQAFRLRSWTAAIFDPNLTGKLNLLQATPVVTTNPGVIFGLPSGSWLNPLGDTGLWFGANATEVWFNTDYEAYNFLTGPILLDFFADLTNTDAVNAHKVDLYVAAIVELFDVGNSDRGYRGR